MVFTVGVTSGHTLNRDIELSFSTVDGLIAGESLHYDAHNISVLDLPPTHPHIIIHTQISPLLLVRNYTSVIDMSFILSAGMQTIQISVNLNPDQLYENNEMFQGILSLITTDRVSLSPGTADATIIDGGGLYNHVYTIHYYNYLTHRGDCWFHQPTILCQGGRRTNHIHCGSD